MLKFKDIVRYICATVLCFYKYLKNLFQMNSVYDCARPFLMLAGICGLGGNRICEIDGVRCVRNSRFSFILAAVITLILTPSYIIHGLCGFFSGKQLPLFYNVATMLIFGRNVFTLSTMAMTCIRTHVYYKNLTKVLQILHNTDVMLKRENIHVNYWKIVLKIILFGLISWDSVAVRESVHRILEHYSTAFTTIFTVKLLLEIAYEIYFMWLILFMLMIRERFVGLNKLLLQNAQVPSIIQDDSLLRRIPLARDIHVQLSEAIALFSDISRFLIIGLLVPGMLQSIINAISVAEHWTKSGHMMALILIEYAYYVACPSIKTVTLCAVCQTHKNNRRVFSSRLRHLIAREEDPRTVHQLQQYIWYIHDTPAGLLDFQLDDVDFMLLFTVIDIIIQYLFVVYSYFRPSIQGETM